MDISEKIRQLPQQSGVYLFRDQTGSIIYIGKAISLKNRVSSYFNQSHSHSAKISKMIKEISDIEYILTQTEMEALLLESRLVKKNKPAFNTQLKDDKSYPYIKITKKDPFPAIFFIRKNKNDSEGKSYFCGPFIDVEITRKAIGKLREMFKIRNCSQRKFKIAKACLDYQIGLCSAPCAGKIKQADYEKKVRECCLLLSGKYNKLLQDLKKEMYIASQLMFYEKAAKTRDTIKMIEKVISQERISKSYRKKVETYIRMDATSIAKALQDLKCELQLDRIPLHIEAFDISNIHGQISVGSMVVFQSGIPDKKRYRHFKIKSVKGINDYAMMKEVIYRRFAHKHTVNNPLPDLLLLDGGKGQLNIITGLLKELNLNLNLVSLAKREEELFQPGKKEPIMLSRDSEAFFLIQRIRDEAHRFAISFHKKLRSQLIRSSVIDFIPGIGEKRKRELLSTFKSVEDIRKTEISQLMQIQGIGEKTARKIKDILEARYDFKIQ